MTEHGDVNSECTCGKEGELNSETLKDESDTAKRDVKRRIS